MRVLMVISYDGTNYNGWQKQDNALGIEEVLNQHLSDLFQSPIEIIGASRTDSGVHALCNIAVFDVETKMEATRVASALNQRLPQDIRIMHSEQVEDDFHPRYCQCEKTYEYSIYNRSINNPIGRQYSYFVYFNLDIDEMKRAASYLIGEHDFASFCSARSQVKTTTRTVHEISIEREGDYILIRIRGNGFLYNMVRIIVGTLLQIGRGKRRADEMLDILNACDRAKAGPTAPAHGLTLVDISYLE